MLPREFPKTPFLSPLKGPPYFYEASGPTGRTGSRTVVHLFSLFYESLPLHNSKCPFVHLGFLPSRKSVCIGVFTATLEILLSLRLEDNTEPLSLLYPSLSAPPLVLQRKGFAIHAGP